MTMRFQCPICSQPVDENGDEFRWVVITDWNGFLGKDYAPEQTFPAHFECLNRRIGDVSPVI